MTSDLISADTRTLHAAPTSPPAAAPPPRPLFLLIAPLLALSALLSTLGCAQRRIEVTSTPPGALVWINDVEVGRTPLQTAFTFYGSYDVRLRKEGFAPIATSRRAQAPLYDLPPLDLATAASPVPVITTISWHFDLTPLPAPGTGPEDPGALQARAREMRRLLAEPP